MQLQTYVKEKIAKIPPEIMYISLLYIITRIVLTLIGVVSQRMISKGNITHWTDYSWLNIWGIWDSGWYVHIAQTGYVDKGTIAFFPLYPLLMRLLGTIIGSPYIAGVIISNVCLLVACFFLYRLVMLDSGDKDVPLNSVKYLLLYPTAFVLSGVFTESLFLALLIMAFYYGKKNKWAVTGLLGFFLAITRLIGVFMVLPLGYEYLKSKGFKLANTRIDVLYLLLIPVGLFIFMAYNYYLTGDPVAFIHVESNWDRYVSNPIYNLYEGLIQFKINAFIALFVLAILTIFYKEIGFSYWLTGIIAVGIPLTTSIAGMHRYTLVIFPLYIILARLSKNRNFDQFTTIVLALLQGCLMVIWANGIPGLE
jgi:hypothetical protein